MFCPNCGKDCGEFKFCPECGMQLYITEPDYIGIRAERMFPEPPITRKKVRWGTLEFSSESMRVHIRLPKRPLTDKRIPYNEIFGVSFVPATFWLTGFLCVREWKDRHVPIPRKFSEMTLINVTTWFDVKDNDDFLRIYEFLKQCAEINAMRRQN